MLRCVLLELPPPLTSWTRRGKSEHNEQLHCMYGTWNEKAPTSPRTCIIFPSCRWAHASRSHIEWIVLWIGFRQVRAGCWFCLPAPIFLARFCCSALSWCMLFTLFCVASMRTGRLFFPTSRGLTRQQLIIFCFEENARLENKSHLHSKIKKSFFELFANY